MSNRGGFDSGAAYNYSNNTSFRTNADMWEGPTSVPVLTQVFHNQSLKDTGADDWDAWDGNAPSTVTARPPAPSFVGNTGGFNSQRDGFASDVPRQFASDNQCSGGFGQRNRSLQSDCDENEMKISSRQIGLVIGKGGLRIRELQTSSGAKIFVKKDEVDADGNVRIVFVGDSSSKSCAKKMIDDLIEADSSQPPLDGCQQARFCDGGRPRERFGDSRGPREHFGDSGGPHERFGDGSGSCETLVKFPTNLLGTLFGRGGQNIREISDKTQTRIKVGDRSGVTTDVTITGGADERCQAKLLVEDIIQEEGNSRGNFERSSSGGDCSFAGNRQRSGFGHDDNESSGRFNSFGNSSVGNSGSGFGTRQRYGFGGFDNNESSDGFNRFGNSSFGNTTSQRSFGVTSPVINWDEVKTLSEKHEKEKWKGYPPIKKNFYIEDAGVAYMEPEEIAAVRLHNNNIMVSCDENREARIPNPVQTFDECFIHYPEILEELKRAGFSKPTPIQIQGWPVALQGLDLIGIAQTGTGKTLAFLLPAFIHIEGQPVPREQRGGPNVLVLSPTRELALQIESEVKKYKYRDISCVCVYGGGNRREQINIVTKGVEIVVATPGRLNDLISNGIIDVRSVTYLVLDEADRMLDLGFEPEIRKILIDVRPDRQTIMTSATWPAGVRRLATSYMTNPIRVFVGSLDLTAVHSVRQRVEFLQEDDKRNRLVEFLTLEMEDDDKAIVFVGRKCTVDSISSDFALSDIRCQSIHGGREQCDREQALDDLKTGVVRILIATDVASRGIDIKDVTHVVNFDFPHNIEEYVHRVGRTGRAGLSGESLTFMTRSDWRFAAELIKILEEAQQEVPRELRDMAQRYGAMRERRRNENSNGFGGRGDFDDFSGFGGGDRRGGRRDRERSMRVAYM